MKQTTKKKTISEIMEYDLLQTDMYQKVYNMSQRTCLPRTKQRKKHVIWKSEGQELYLQNAFFNSADRGGSNWYKHGTNQKVTFYTGRWVHTKFQAENYEGTKTWKKGVNERNTLQKYDMRGQIGFSGSG